jgi:hypothetical protein
MKQTGVVIFAKCFDPDCGFTPTQFLEALKGAGHRARINAAGDPGMDWDVEGEEGSPENIDLLRAARDIFNDLYDTAQ